MLLSSRSSYKASLFIYITGPLTQAPRHSTSEIVNLKSFEVQLFSVSNSYSKIYIIFSEPRRRQGLVPQTCKWYLPTGFVLNYE